jgi:porphobilinogen synthase
MVRETELSINDFIYPLFVVPGKGVRKEVKSMPGVFQLSVDETVKECREVRSLRIPAVILFGIPEHKDEVGSEAYDANGIVQRAIRAIKKDIPELTVITDVCLCEYTSHGHCGIVRGEEIVNDESIELLAKEALTHAEAGADMVAPSDMFDASFRNCQLCPMQQNMHQDSTVLSGMLLRVLRNLAIDAPTRWIRQIPTKLFEKLNRIYLKEQILSW